ncbi:hypothetical protein [Acetobacterium sp.]|uniref:hypothetical protein n=1 Tax=Acetobacterium sp. TaxID=1872094 RepID=UPI002F421A06
MGFFSKMKEKMQTIEKTATEIKKVGVQKNSKSPSRYETNLNGVKTGNRQEVLSGIESDVKLKVLPVFTRDPIFLEVYIRTPTGVRSKTKKEVIGTIPPNIVKEIVNRYGRNGFKPIITKYKISKNASNTFECSVSLQIDSDE